MNIFSLPTDYDHHCADRHRRSRSDIAARLSIVPQLHVVVQMVSGITVSIAGNMLILSRYQGVSQVDIRGIASVDADGDVRHLCGERRMHTTIH